MADTSPATKKDIKLLMEMIGTQFDETRRIIAESEERMTQRFDLAVETIRHDLAGAHRDRIEDHEQRIGRLERITGVKPH